MINVTVQKSEYNYYHQVSRDANSYFLFQVVAKFDKVTKLHVNNITINSWEEVSKLRWFPSLNDVRMVHWDLFGVCFLFEECYYDTCFFGIFGVCYIVTLFGVCYFWVIS